MPVPRPRRGEQNTGIPARKGSGPFAPRQRFRFVYAVPLFVGEAYMPPGRGTRHAGFAGNTTVYAAPIIFQKFFMMFGGRERPPYKAKQTPGRPDNAK